MPGRLDESRERRSMKTSGRTPLRATEGVVVVGELIYSL